MTLRGASFVVMLGAVCWAGLGTYGIAKTTPRADASFVVPHAPLQSTRIGPNGPEIRIQASTTSFDRERVVAEIDGRAADVRWDVDQLVVATGQPTPGVHHLAAGIEHRGGVRRFVSTAFLAGETEPAARTYARALQLTLPEKLFDDGDPESETDLVGAVVVPVRRSLAQAARRAGLGEIEELGLGIDLGEIDDALTVMGEVRFGAGTVTLVTDLRLVRLDGRRLALRRGRTHVEVDERLRDWAATQGAMGGGLFAALAGGGPLAILLAAALGSEMGEGQAVDEAREKVGETIDAALRSINGRLELPETWNVPGLPADSAIALRYAGRPYVARGSGVVLTLDVLVHSTSAVAGPALDDPIAIEPARDDDVPDVASLRVSRSLLAGLMPLVANQRTIDDAMGDAVGAVDPSQLPVHVERIRALSPALPSGMRASGLSWSVPALEVSLREGATALAFLAGGLEVSVGPAGESLRVRAVPTFIRIGCRERAAATWILRPCLDVVATVAPDLPSRLAAHVEPTDLFADVLRELRTLPLDGSGRMNLAAVLVDARALDTGAYAVELDFDVNVEAPERQRPRPRHRRRPH